MTGQNTIISLRHSIRHLPHHTPNLFKLALRPRSTHRGHRHHSTLIMLRTRAINRAIRVTTLHRTLSSLFNINPHLLLVTTRIRHRRFRAIDTRQRRNITIRTRLIRLTTLLRDRLMVTAARVSHRIPKRHTRLTNSIPTHCNRNSNTNGHISNFNATTLDIVAKATRNRFRQRHRLQTQHNNTVRRHRNPTRVRTILLRRQGFLPR